jgi:hypothetical protein
LKDLVNEAQDHMDQQATRTKERAGEMKGDANRAGEQARSSAKA